MEKTPVANIAPFGLRMQPELKATIEAEARANNRSLNSEIVHRLEESLRSFAYEMDFESGGSRRAPPDGWYRKVQYTEFSEDEIFAAVTHYTDELNAAVGALRQWRERHKRL